MANNNGVIYVGTTGVSIGDIQTVLNRSESDLGLLCSDQKWNSGGTALQPANKINKWAKYKPIKHANKGYVTAAERKVANQGFHVATSGSDSQSLLQTTETAAFNAASTNNADWVYDKPTGTIGVSPFRIDDFACINTSLSDRTSPGYNHNSSNPFYLDDVVTDRADQTLIVKGRVDFHYRQQQIAFTDLGTLADSYPSSYVWYWCLFAKVPGDNNNVSILPLYSDQAQTTRLAVGSPSNNTLRGFFQVQITASAYGDSEAYLGMVLVDTNSPTSGNTWCVYAPVEKDASFTIMNDINEIRVGLVGTSSNSALIATWTEISGVKYITNFSSHIQVLYLGYNDLPSNVNLVITESIYGKLQGSYQTTLVRERVSTFSVGPTAGSGGSASGSWGFQTPMACDPVGDLAYTVKAQLGSMSPIYFVVSSVPSLQHSNSEVLVTMDEIITNFGSTYGKIVQQS